MRKRLFKFLFLLIIISNDVLGKDGNRTKLTKVHKEKNHLKGKSDGIRMKRSLLDDDDKPFWANRGKKHLNDNPRDELKHGNDLDNNYKVLQSRDQERYQPFWGNRDGRDSSSIENYIEEYSDHKLNKPNYGNDIFCKHCSSENNDALNLKKAMGRREEVVSPFWGNRGRRNSDESDAVPETFLVDRGSRQDNIDPFWGNRGRKKDDSPFWGNRGRREDEPFWGNRGRRQDSNFWENPEGLDDEPFWGNRGRRIDSEPFWGSRGRRQETEPFWGNRGRRKEDLKETLLKAFDNVADDIENLSRLRRSSIASNSFWMHRGRDSIMKFMFNDPSRNRVPLKPKQKGIVLGGSLPEPGSVHDNRMFVDEPHYILVERTSRSSAEDDPYFISRGKKYYLKFDTLKAARDRRGAIEEIVKSVRNDPYYIARGKKDIGEIKMENSTTPKEEFVKVKDLICSAFDLINIKSENIKVKRQANDNERDRRTILKKLALQLQMDPYFVSRGKKDDPDSKENIQEFINDVATKCT